MWVCLCVGVCVCVWVVTCKIWVTMGTGLICVCLSLSLSCQPDSASNGDSDHSATLSKLEGVVPSTCGYNENDRILVWYGKGKNIRTYEAKIVTCEENEAHRDYLVHYNGWNNRSVGLWSRTYLANASYMYMYITLLLLLLLLLLFLLLLLLLLLLFLQVQ